MSEFHFFIDTNFLPPNPAKAGIGFRRLLELGEKGIIKTHLSQVVLDEWRTQVQAKLEEQLLGVIKAVKEVNRQQLATNAGIVENGYVALQAQAEADLAGASDTISSYVAAFCNQMGALVHTIPGECILNVWKDYLVGGGAFKSVKERDGFPDALILETFKVVRETIPHEIHVVCGDKKLLEQLKLQGGVTDHKSLNAFIEYVAKAAPDHVNWLKFAPYVLENAHKFIEDFDERVAELLGDYRLSSPYHLGEGGDTIGWVENVDKIEFGAAEDMGAGWVVVPYSCLAEAEIHFWLNKWEALNPDEDVTLTEPIDPDEYGVMACTTKPIEIQGEVSLHFAIEDLEKDVNAEPTDIIFEMGSIELDRLE